MNWKHVALSVLLTPAVCLAQAPADEAPAGTGKETPSTGKEAVDDQGRRIFKDQLVVTATRQKQASADTPAPVTVIERFEIERRQPEKLVDLFKQVPGMETFGEGPFRGLPVIRGLSSNRVLVLVDGQRLNNGRESTSFAGIQPGLVDLSQVERIEVLRGPASVQYGSDALGGVINIITRQPDLGGEAFSWNGEASVDYGSAADSQSARFELSGAGRGFAIRLAASHREADDYTVPDEAADVERFAAYVSDDEVPNSGMEQTTFDTSLRWSTGDRGVLRVDLESVRTDDIGFPGFDPETSGVDISFPNFDRDKLSATWETGPLGFLDTLSLTAYSQTVTKESRRNLSFGPFFFSNNFTRSDIDSWGGNVQGLATAGAHSLTFGLDFYRDDIDDDTVSESTMGSGTEVAVPKSYQRGVGFYVQDQIEVGDRLTLHAGLRGDTFDFVSEDDPDYAGEAFDESDSAVSGNLGLTYGVTDNVQLTALVGRGFRSPNLQERSFFGLATTGDTFILQNPDLDSESSLNYEIGVKARYDRHFGGLSLFYNDISDFISYEFLGPDPDTGLELARFANVEEATIKGVELELETIFANNWTLFEAISYTRGDNRSSGEPLSFIPPLKVVAGLRYQTARWWGEGSIRFVDRQDRVSTDQDESPGFTVYDLRGGYDFANGLSIQATLANITNKLYAEPFNNRPEPARNVRMAVRYRF